jgi:hypothetical protein
VSWHTIEAWEEKVGKQRQIIARIKDFGQCISISFLIGEKTRRCLIKPRVVVIEDILRAMAVSCIIIELIVEIRLTIEKHRVIIVCTHV